MNFSNMYLFLTFIIGMSIALGKTAYKDNTIVSSLENKQEYSQSQSYYDDEETSEQVEKGSLTVKSTIKPFFEDGDTIKYVNIGNNVTLNCPVRNYDESHHHIMWKKEFPITNNKVVLNKEYQLNGNFSLTFNIHTPKLLGNYTCNVLPANITKQISVVLEDVHSTNLEENTNSSDGNIYDDYNFIFPIMTFAIVIYRLR